MPRARSFVVTAALVLGGGLAVGCGEARGSSGGDEGRARGARGAQSDAPSAVIFVHGTSDQTPQSATDDYWTQDALDRFRNGLPYLVVGYQGASYAADDPQSWGAIADQIDRFTQENAVERIVVVTHSNGANPVRYLLRHPNANAAVSRVVALVQQVIFLAGDSAGTPLADKVTTSSTAAHVANSVGQAFGLMNYDGPAVWEQRVDTMATLNGNGTFDDGSDRGTAYVNGSIPAVAVSGTSVYAAIWSSDAYCGGYGMTAGLKATLMYGWGYSGCADGFVGCDSAQYVGYVPAQGIGVADDRLNHNQSRRGCHGEDGFVSSSISGAFGYSAPSDYVVSPSAQACNATTRGWDSTHRWFWYGCPDPSWVHDGKSEHDCFVAYGTDESKVAPRDYASTAYASHDCPDSLRGDGVCDLCIVAKYGYDVLEGSADGADDCVNEGAGTKSTCRDLAWDQQAGAVVTATYAATH